MIATAAAMIPLRTGAFFLRAVLRAKGTLFVRMLVVALLAFGLAACAALDPDRPTFDGQTFRAKASQVGEDRRMFLISVRPVSASLVGAREAGRFEATKYCIKNFGSSAASWTVGPDDDPGAYVVENDTLTLQGTCAG